MLDPVQDSRPVQQEMPVVDFLRDVAADWSLIIGDGSSDNVSGFAVTPHAPAQLRELAQLLSALTSERVRTVQRILAAEHYKEADEERKAFSSTNHKGIFAACPHPFCIENKDLLTALSALAGSTNG